MPLRKRTDISPDKNADHEPSRADLFGHDDLFFRDFDPKQQDTLPCVGQYVADYSELTVEEIAQTDLECEEVFKYSRPVASAAAPSITGLECEELLKHSRPVSADADNIELELAALIKHSKPRSR